MRHICPLFMALLITETASAQLNYLSTNSSIQASGTVIIHQYATNSYSHSDTNGTVSGSAYASDPNKDTNGFGGEYSHIQSSAQLTTTATASQLSCSSSVSVIGGGPYDTSGGKGIGNATTSCDVTFSVSTPLAFQASLNYRYNIFQPEIQSSFNVTLTSAQKGFIGGWGNTIFSLPIPFGGVLVPGDIYTLHDTMQTGGAIDDPLGESGDVEGAFVLTVVPNLNIQSTKTNTVVISWLAGGSGIRLQENTPLGTTNWVNNTNTVISVGNQNQVIVTNVPDSRFYRLIKQ